MKGKTAGKIIALFAVAGMLAGCGGKTGTTPDDYATNDGYITTETAGNSTGGAQSDTTSGTAGISKENIKVGVLYISDPDEGSGYSYTHDLGIVGMQENLGLSDDQIERKIVDDSDAKATEEAIEACISDGCNIIFTTSWGYMETTAEMAEKYPDIEIVPDEWAYDPWNRLYVKWKELQQLFWSYLPGKVFKRYRGWHEYKVG